MNDLSEVPLLTASEARALGCLIEKEAATPEAYPLTVNATHVAANQKTARDPVMALTPGEVHHALRQLEAKGLAKQTFSSRAERFEHRTGASLGLPGPQVTLVGLLLLRGAQTAHELLARSERTGHFADVEGVRHHLDRLIQRTPALAVRIPRGPGQREDRYMHLLSGPVDISALSERKSSRQEPDASGLEDRVVALEEDVAALREQVAELLRQR